MKFPGVAEYEDAISLGKKSFETLDLEFEYSNYLSRIWTHGTGQFAVVFKAKIEGNYYAIRCFQHATEQGLEKYSVLSDYFKKEQNTWLSKFIYYDNEIIVGAKKYPVLVMDWVDGIDIHDFISENIHSNYWLLELQKSLISLSDSLEKTGIGHGDFQKGNILVLKDKKKIILKLIDYDGMFVMPMSGQLSIELGKPDIQHPKRNKDFFNEKIDRFSIWLILTAIEAVKYNNDFWERISDGGFNDGSNFLFRYEDLNNTTNSKLFSKLLDSPNSSVKEYATILSKFCNSSIEEVISPILLVSVKKEINLDKDVIPTDTKKAIEEEEGKIKPKAEIDVPKEKKIKKGGKEFDVEEDSIVTKKGGKEFDVEDVKDKSNAAKLSHTIKLKNMFLGLFVIASILSLFLIFRYSDTMSDYSGKKHQLEDAANSIQSLNEDLNEMTISRDSWRSDYYTMENNRDSWRSDYYTMEGYRDSWQSNYYDLLDKWNDLVYRWNNHTCF